MAAAADGRLGAADTSIFGPADGGAEGQARSGRKRVNGREWLHRVGWLRLGANLELSLMA